MPPGSGLQAAFLTDVHLPRRPPSVADAHHSSTITSVWRTERRVTSSNFGQALSDGTGMNHEFWAVMSTVRSLIIAAIDDYTTDWRKVRELQGVGACGCADLLEQAQAVALFKRKFARTRILPTGIMHVVRPIEMHFVDYDYNVVTAQGQQSQAPEVTSRTFTMGAAEAAVHAAVSTSLDRSTFAAGEVIFRPGDPPGQYYVVVEGEVEARGEGYGADQTVTRVGPGELFGDQAAFKVGGTTIHRRPAPPRLVRFECRLI